MIAPEVLDKQRGLSVVPRMPDATYSPCRKCGLPTRAKSGTCRECHNGRGLPDPRAMTTERIAAYVEVLRAELKRRRDELNAALNEEG